MAIMFSKDKDTKEDRISPLFIIFAENFSQGI